MDDYSGYTDDELASALAEVFGEWLDSDSCSEALAPYGRRYVLSDIDEKIVAELAGRDGPLTGDDMDMLSEILGDEPDFDGDEDGGMVEEYAENLRNYLYTYKESARETDPSIDTHEEHRGPMAQDIEKVAPDCVKETDGGVKVVDGDRLALVNAGVIGDLARRVIALEDRVNGGR